MNMGNVMGTVSWISKDFTSEGRLSIGSSGHKDLFIGIGLEGSSLEAKGGIIGGLLNLGKIDIYARQRYFYKIENEVFLNFLDTRVAGDLYNSSSL